MMIIDATTRAGLIALRKLERRAEPEPATVETVAAVLEAVRLRGDAAVAEFAEKFDRVRLTPRSFAVPVDDCASAWKALPAGTKRLLKASHANVAAFARASLRKSWRR